MCPSNRITIERKINWLVYSAIATILKNQKGHYNTPRMHFLTLFVKINKTFASALRHEDDEALTIVMCFFISFIL